MACVIDLCSASLGSTKDETSEARYFVNVGMYAFAGEKFANFYAPGAHTIAPQLAPADTLLTPKVMIEVLGQNDSNSTDAPDVATVQARVAAFFSEAWTASPDLRVVVVKVFPSFALALYVGRVNQAIDNEVALWRAAGKIIEVAETTAVDWQPEDSSDHPTKSGYGKYAALIAPALRRVCGYDGAGYAKLTGVVPTLAVGDSFTTSVLGAGSDPWVSGWRNFLMAGGSETNAQNLWNLVIE